MKFLQGFFKPKHPSKYKGDPTKIVYRSSWELKMMLMIDHNNDVDWWQSEEFYIPYYDPTRDTVGHYYPDMRVKYKNGKTIIYEIKPHNQTTIPILDKKGKRKPLKEAILFEKNNAKWEAARKYCKQRGYEFELITEKELGIRCTNKKQ